VAQSDRYRPGREHTSRTYPVVPPIYQTTTFELDDLAYEDIQGTGGLHETWYSRLATPRSPLPQPTLLGSTVHSKR
jgi:cystathionine beta-lyase/cystathionine gamma-synthase